jgi:uncharacterized protein (DUF2236 family)
MTRRWRRIAMASQKNPWREHDRQVFEDGLKYVRDTAAGPVEGLFDPEGATWRISREVALLAGGGRALLLQLAHPAVAQGVESHSHFRADPIGRGQRTFTSVYQIFFGDLQTALVAARHVHALHDRVYGTIAAETSRRQAGQSYRANDPQALLWVWATLVDTTLLVFERVIRPLSRQERREYYRDVRRFAVIMGTPEDQVPASYPAFRSYFDSMVTGPSLEVGETASSLSDELFGSLWKASHLDRALTSGIMPPNLRTGFGLPWGPADRRLHDRAWAVIRAVMPRLPALMRFPPAYHQAVARVDAAADVAPPASSQFMRLLSRSIPMPLGLGRGRA